MMQGDKDGELVLTLLVRALVSWVLMCLQCMPRDSIETLGLSSTSG